MITPYHKCLGEMHVETVAIGLTHIYVYTVINCVYRVDVYHIPCCTPSCDLIMHYDIC